MKPIKTIGLISGLLISMISFAQGESSWQLNEQLSSISFQSVKNGQVVENHQLSLVNWTISEQGEATVDIALGSINSGIEIRDERMQEHLFEVTKFPIATVKNKVKLDDIPLNTPVILDAEMQLSLHGVTKAIQVKLAVTRTEKSIQISTQNPYLLNANDFGLGAGVDKLQEIAKLNIIAKTVPVHFTTVFEKLMK